MADKDKNHDKIISDLESEIEAAKAEADELPDPETGDIVGEANRKKATKLERKIGKMETQLEKAKSDKVESETEAVAAKATADAEHAGHIRAIEREFANVAEVKNFDEAKMRKFREKAVAQATQWKNSPRLPTLDEAKAAFQKMANDIEPPAAAPESKESAAADGEKDKKKPDEKEAERMKAKEIPTGSDDTRGGKNNIRSKGSEHDKAEKIALSVLGPPDDQDTGPVGPNADDEDMKIFARTYMSDSVVETEPKY